MRRVGVVLAAGLLVLAACGDDAKPSATSNASSATSETRATPVAKLTLEGDDKLSGAIANASVRCGFPNLDGPSIAVLGDTADPHVQIQIGVTSAKVTVHIYTGTGTVYFERAYESTATLEDFDAKRGVTLDAPLSEVEATKGSSPGNVGTLSAIRGTLDCADQDPGSSTITISGETPEGPIKDAPLESPRVECNRPGDEVVVIGILRAGTTKSFVKYGLRPEGTSVQQSFADGTGHDYEAPPGTSSLTGTGAHVDADAVEQPAATPPRTLHLEGDVVCSTDPT
ncbi:MAG: hypothetical protein QOE35_194 [Actinomycetota bacterium]